MNNNSYWVDSAHKQSYPSIEKDETTNVCIVGGGLAGTLTAYLLSKQGLKVTILEKDEICMGVTANSTGKLTSQHGLFYKYLEDAYGKDFAKGYLDSNEQAISLVEKIIKEENIECDFERQDAYVFATAKQEVEKIADEVRTVKSLGLDAEYLTKMPFELNKVLAAIKFPNQAQLHPRKYVLGLLKSLESNGVNIYENSKVVDVEKHGNGYTVYTENNKVTAQYVVITTHYPIINFPGFYFTKMHQDKSYIIAVDTHEDLFEGMYISSWDPVISFRTTPYKDKRLLLVAGSDHKTGANDVPMDDRFLNLENYIKNIFPKSEVKYRWSTEDCVSLDKIPYIGQYSTFLPNMYVATGFKKWGISSSHVAASIISDSILGKENKYSKIYTSTRVNPIKNSKEFGNMLKQSVYSLAINKLTSPTEIYENLTPDSGGVVEFCGKKIGIYKDPDGKLHAIKPYCSHLGCELTWNNLEKTWDCPCHGSRYTFEGKIITEPTRKDLEIINLD